MGQFTTVKLRKMKKNREKIVMTTAYDYPGAKIVDEAGTDIILVGDSLGVVVLGYPNTLSVTMEDMLHHTKAVARGTKQAMIISDLPFMSYQVSGEQAMVNAGRLIQEAGAQGVKLEGGAEVAPTVARITAAGIPVFGHLGFTPQSVNQIGGAIFQGKSAQQGKQLLEDALRLEDAGVCGIVLELVPWEVAEEVTQRLTVPTIGIGSGPACDGQVLVFHDLLAMAGDFRPKHGKVYLEAGQLMTESVRQYADEVRQAQFPTSENTRRMDPDEYRQFVTLIANTISKGNHS